MHPDYLKPEYMRRDKQPVRNDAKYSRFVRWSRGFKQTQYKKIRKMNYRYI
jgi:hypothetical protein